MKLQMTMISGMLVCIPLFSQEKPNIVIILADDIGWGDLGCYGADRIPTPNIDGVADDGVIFTSGYAPASTSTPTRYSMLTGELAIRRNLQILAGDAPMSVPADNLASMLKKEGYRTAVIGKWHLGLGDGNIDWNSEIRPSPNDVGFDYSFVIPGTVDRVPCVFVENGRVYNHDVSKGDKPIAVSYRHKVGSDPTGKENPELQKLCWIKENHSNTIVNGIARIGWMTGGYRARWVDETISEFITVKARRFIGEACREPFFLYFATHDAHEPRIVNPRFEGTSGAGRYGDMVAQFDASVGEVVDALKDAGIYDNTIIIISSDNGPMIKEAYDDGALEGLGGHDPYNGLRGAKYSIYEGGLRVPFIFSWPAQIRGGRTDDTPVSLLNLKPTLASLAGIDADTAPGYADAQDDSSIYCGHNPVKNDVYLQRGDGKAVAIRSGEWKYIEYKDGRHELYNLGTDPYETCDLSGSETGLVSELSDRLESKLKR